MFYLLLICGGSSWPPMSDISQVLEADDILGVQQAIKGFDKSDFCEVISMNLPFFNIEPNHNMWHPPMFMKLRNIYEKYANEDRTIRLQ